MSFNTRFIDIFCLRDHLWFYEAPSIELRSLGLIANRDATAAVYTDDAIGTFKYKNPKHRDFWAKQLVSTLYFANMHSRVDFIAPYPGHKAGCDNEVVHDALITFAKCFRKTTYCPDLIVRHTEAPSSRRARLAGTALDHRTQLNTIHVTERPSRHGKATYKNPPWDKPRSILVVDDFTTEGYGLDSARAYLRAVPRVKDIFLVSLLRFPNREVHELTPLPKIADPFQQNTFAAPLKTKVHPYASGVVDPKSTKEIAEHFTAYDAWTWPPGL